MTSTWLSIYIGILNPLLVTTAFVILVSGVDDLFIDLCYWAGEFYRAVIKRQPPPEIAVETLHAREERWFAIMVPAWRESDVIAHMIQNTIETLDYEHFVVFLGTYQNDPETTAEVDKMVARYPHRMERAEVAANGPTCKADCLNWILRAILAHENRQGMRFAGVLMHDCEDVIHPLELQYFNAEIDNHDLIQLPVASLPLPWSAWVAGTYLDDFAEVHQKDIVVRQQLTGLVPGAGVALCYGRDAIGAVMSAFGGKAFNTATLTEDYDFSFRLAALGFTRQTFARYPLRQAAGASSGIHWRAPATSSRRLATCEYFPSEFRAAYRQRARWILGIAFLGWQQLHWRGNWMHKYMLLRDRKGVVTAPLSMLAYVLLLNTLAILAFSGGHFDGPVASRLVLFADWLRPVLAINALLLVNRLLERVYFVARQDGLMHGLLSVPRTVLNNVINFAAVSRAWKQFSLLLVRGKAIAWDKTDHTFPSYAELAHHRRRLGEILVARGVISAADLETAVSRQRVSGLLLGQELIAEGRLTPELLADTLAEQADLPRARPDSGPVPALAVTLPPDLMRRHHVVPFAKADETTLQVAVSGMPDAAVTQRIRASTGLDVAYVVACDYEVDQWVAEAARDQGAA